MGWGWVGGGGHSLSLFHKTLELFQLLDKLAIILVPTHLQGARNVTADALSLLDSPSPTEDGVYRSAPQTVYSLPSGLR